MSLSHEPVSRLRSKLNNWYVSAGNEWPRLREKALRLVCDPHAGDHDFAQLFNEIRESGADPTAITADLTAIAATLTDTESRILKVLNSTTGMIAARIGEKAKIGHDYVRQLMPDLQRRGLIQKVKGSGYLLTDLGNQVVQRAL
jgi:hypothetical protein